MDVIKQIDYMIACLEMVKEEINYKKRWEMKIKMREDNDWNWYKRCTLGQKKKQMGGTNNI